jgi:hypothetical protein
MSCFLNLSYKVVWFQQMQFLNLSNQTQIANYNWYVYVMSFENHINDGNLWQMFYMIFEK